MLKILEILAGLAFVESRLDLVPSSLVLLWELIKLGWETVVEDVLGGIDVSLCNCVASSLLRWSAFKSLT